MILREWGHLIWMISLEVAILRMGAGLIWRRLRVFKAYGLFPLDIVMAVYHEHSRELRELGE